MKMSCHILLPGLLSIFLLPFAIKSQVLNVPLVIQEQTNWCWDASSKCVLDYFGFVNAQCTIAEYTRTVATWHNFGLVDCCIDPTQGCNYWNYNWGYAGSIEDILIHFGNIHTNNLGTYLSISQIQTEVTASRPFIFRWGWYSGGGHFLVGYGISGTDMYYMNPLPGYGYEISNYYWVVDDGSTHTWTHTQTLCLPSIPGPVTGNTNVCQGSSQTYSVSSVPSATSYTWTLPAGWSGSSNSVTINTTAGSGGGTIKVTANNSCGISMPRTLAVAVNPLLPVSISIMASANPVCAGTTVNFIATPANGGSSPFYQWKVNNSNAGTNNPVYSYIPVNNDVIKCILTSGALCVTGNPATSNLVTMTVNSVSIGGNVTGGYTIAIGQSTGTLTLSGQNGSVTKWQRQLNNSGYTDIPSTSGLNTYTEIPQSLGNWDYRAVVKSGVCTEVNSSSATVTVAGAPLTRSWLGTFSDEWDNPLNWDPGGAPYTVDNVIVPNYAANMPRVKVSGLGCHDLLIKSGATVIINPGQTLTISGTTTLEGP